MGKFLENHKPLYPSQYEAEYLNNSKIEFVSKTISYRKWPGRCFPTYFLNDPDMQDWSVLEN